MPKRKQKEDQPPTETVTVKSGFRHCCKNNDLYVKIVEDVREISSLIVETSRYIHFSLMKRWQQDNFAAPRFLDFFYCLCQKHPEKYVLDSEYGLLRNDLPLYNSAYRSNLFVDAADTYKTIFHNNIWMHAYSRIRRFLRRVDGSTPATIYNTLDYLFVDNSCKQPDETLLSQMRTHLDWDGQKFKNIKKINDYWQYMRFFYKLQCYNEENNIKNFALIPIKKFGAHHVRYDSSQLWATLCSRGLFKGSQKAFEPNRDAEWRKYFEFPETTSKKFGYSMMTDGVSISFCMAKTLQAAAATTSRVKCHKKANDYAGDLSKIRNTDYDIKIGLDPGLRLIVGGTRNGLPLKISNSRYQHEAGYHSRKVKLQRWTQTKTSENISEEEQKLRQLSPYSADFRSYTRYQLSIFAAKQEIFSQRRVTRLKLQKFICTEKAAHRIATEIIGKDLKKIASNALVCIGSTSIAANSPMRGYIRTPKPKLISALKSRGADIMLVNEFRTTKLCGKCHAENITSRSPHRYQFCPNCRTCWNRDVNAGVNILYIGECLIGGITTHPNFHRNNDDEPPPMKKKKKNKPSATK